MGCRGQNITTVLDPDHVDILLAKLKFESKPNPGLFIPVSMQYLQYYYDLHHYKY